MYNIYIYIYLFKYRAIFQKMMPFLTPALQANLLDDVAYDDQLQQQLIFFSFSGIERMVPMAGNALWLLKPPVMDRSREQQFMWDDTDNDITQEFRKFDFTIMNHIPYIYHKP